MSYWCLEDTYVIYKACFQKSTICTEWITMNCNYRHNDDVLLWRLMSHTNLVFANTNNSLINRIFCCQCCIIFVKFHTLIVYFRFTKILHCPDSTNMIPGMCGRSYQFLITLGGSRVSPPFSNSSSSTPMIVISLFPPIIVLGGSFPGEIPAMTSMVGQLLQFTIT